MDNIKISLAIFGNQNSNSGFQPLYWINNPPQQLENIVPPGMDENSYFFTLQVLPTHTQYTLIHNRVSSYMSVRPGVLKMAIAIPKGYSIRDGVSPLEVLLDVRQQFINTCMTLRDSHTEAYNYKEKLADADLFTSIVDSYELVPNALPHLPMTGQEDAIMLIDEMTIAQLFIAPQHPEFQKFRSIIVANKGNASVYKKQFSGIPVSAVASPVISPDKSDVTKNYSDFKKNSSDFSKNSSDFSKYSSDFSKNSSEFEKNNVRLSETKSDISINKSQQQKERLLLLFLLLIAIAVAAFLLISSSDKKPEKEAPKEVIENNVEDEPEKKEVINGKQQKPDPKDGRIEIDETKQGGNTMSHEIIEEDPVITPPPVIEKEKREVPPLEEDAEYNNNGEEKKTGTDKKPRFGDR